jgi:hypothetical protein
MNNFNKLTNIEKQKMPSSNETDPKVIVTKAPLYAMKAAQKYKLKGLRLDNKK